MHDRYGPRDLYADLNGVAFVTVLVAVFDPANRSVTSVRAGHNPMIRFHPDRDPALREFRDGGLGIGLTNSKTFEERLVAETAEIQPGDLFLLYTDGIVEAKNRDNVEFGVENLVGVLRRAKGTAAPLLLQDLATELDRYTGNQPMEDDITAVCVKFS